MKSIPIASSRVNACGNPWLKSKAPAYFTTSALALIFALHAGAATTVTLDHQVVEDNTLISGGIADRNFGGAGTFSAGTLTSTNEQVAILRFNVSALDGLYTAGTGITAITLRLYYAADGGTGQGTAEVTTNVYAITSANRGWVEGNANGVAISGTSNWDDRVRVSEDWAGSTGLRTAGTDYNTTLLSSATVNLSTFRPAAGDVVDFTFTGSNAALTALIDSWMVDNVDFSRTNAGLLLRDPDPVFSGSLRNRMTFNSSEATESAFRPQLIISYVPEPSTALLGALGLLVLLRRHR